MESKRFTAIILYLKKKKMFCVVNEKTRENFMSTEKQNLIEIVFLNRRKSNAYEF